MMSLSRKVSVLPGPINNSIDYSLTIINNYQYPMLRCAKSHKFGTSLLRIYQQTINRQSMEQDHRQVRVIQQLQRLHDGIMDRHDQWLQFRDTIKQEVTPQHKFFVHMQFGSKREEIPGLSSTAPGTAQAIKVPGLYLHGSSGTGKTFLSEIFYNNLDIKEKQRTHFHEFMAFIHAELFELQKHNKGYDPVTLVAQKTAKKIRLLYLDEFQVTDVADASILRRLFERLISYQMVLLATTNRPPEDLYKGGHQRELFLPFIDFLKRECVVFDIDSARDYRYELEIDGSRELKTYISPISENSSAEMRRLLSNLTGQRSPHFSALTVQPIAGRQLVVPRACGLVCVYDFKQLLESTMGDSDYRALCKKFKAIVIRNARQIRREERNIANRLIKLFDEAYFRQVKLHIEANVGIEQLIKSVPEALAVTEQDFALIRCKSRLMEFQTTNYKQKPSYAQSQTAQQKAADRPAH